MDIEFAFATPITITKLDLDNIQLANFCRKKANSVRSDLYNQQSDNLDLNEPELQPLLHAVHNTANELYYNLGFKKTTKLNILRAWANIGNNLYIDQPHTHTKGLFTATYYVNGLGVKEHGTLNLLSPATALAHVIDVNHIETNNNFNSFMYEVVPITGNLVMFPSWIIHNVSRNWLEEERISIALDLIVEEITKEK